MDKVYCRFCGRQIDVDAPFCTHCGKQQPLTENNQRINSKQGDGVLEHNVKTNTEGAVKLNIPRFEIILALICFVIVALSMLFGVYGYKYIELSNFCKETFCGTIIVCIIALFFLLIYYRLHKVCGFIYLIVRMFSLAVVVILTGVLFFHFDRIYTFEFDSVRKQYSIYMDLQSSNDSVSDKAIRKAFEIGTTYNDLHSGSVFHEKLLQTIIQRAESGDGVSQGIYGDYFYSFKEGKYKERAFYWWKKAAEKGDARGASRLGDCYANLRSVPDVEKDLALAHKYWMLAAERGSAMSLNRLGDLYGTWKYIGAIRIVVPEGSEKESIAFGCDTWYDDYGNVQFGENYRLPEGFRHDVKLARSYWEKALRCSKPGSPSYNYASEALEKVYPEEQ